MIFRQLFDRSSCTYSYLLGCEVTREAVIIDPVAEQVDRDLTLISELDLTLVYILETHVHADHVTGAAVLRQHTGAKNGLSKAACATCADLAFEHGDQIKFGEHCLSVRSTPGHTNGCVTYVLEAEQDTMAFTGDAILVRGCGRTDFQGGSAQTLFRSIHQQIFTLSGDTILYPGHDYRGHQETTVAQEMAYNPRLNRKVLEEDFVKMMAELKLADPKMMDVAVPANQACGVTEALPTQFQRRVVKTVSFHALNALGDYRLIDVREVDEFDGPLGHLEQAELLPLSQVKEASQGWDPSVRYVFVCRSGVRSALAAKILVDSGFTDVSNLDGGMMSVRAAD